MRLLARIVGTWLFALAIILLIVDGTRSLAANEIVLTSLGTSWQSLDPTSLAGARAFLSTRFFGPLLLPGFEGLLGLPAFLVLGLPGLLIAFAGRARTSPRLVGTDSI